MPIEAPVAEPATETPSGFMSGISRNARTLHADSQPAAPASPAPKAEKPVAAPQSAKETPSPMPQETTPPAAEPGFLNPVLPDDITNILTGEKPVEAKATDEPVDGVLSDKELENAPKGARLALSTMSKKLREANAREKALKAELEQSKTSVKPPTEELTKLQAEIKKREERIQEQERALSLADLTATQEYRRAITEPLKEIGSRVDAIATKNKINTRSLVEAFSKSDENERSAAIAELAAEFSEVDRFKLYSLGEEFAKVQSNRQKMTEDHESALSTIRERRQQEESAGMEARKKQWDEAKQSSLSFIEKVAPFFRKVEGNELWNKKIEGVEGIVDSIDLSKATANDLASMVRSSAILPMASEIIAAQSKQIQELRAINGKFRSATPTAGAEVPGAEPTVDTRGKGFLDSIGKLPR
jgi:hypothetical protein